MLDHFEHLVAGVAAKLGEWLALARGLRLIVTSRERLRVAGEHVLELRPLRLPPPNATSLAEVLGADAGQLFVARAPHLELRPEDGPVLADILHRLDGIPLAIELAAVRTTIPDLAPVRQRLERRFELLAVGARGVATRPGPPCSAPSTGRGRSFCRSSRRRSPSARSSAAASRSRRPRR